MVIVKGRDLPISTKKAIILCKLLQNKRMEPSLKLMEDVANNKKAIKLGRREALKPGRGTKHPIKTAKVFVKMLKNLSANASVKGLDVGKLIITAKADKASSPLRPGARLREFKRTHVLLQGKVVESKK